jgi:hypothetical protein
MAVDYPFYFPLLNSSFIKFGMTHVSESEKMVKE